MDETSAWLEGIKEAFKVCQRGFGVFVDMRYLELNTPEVLKIIEDGQRCGKQRGLGRSVVVVKNPTLAIQFKRTALQSDIYDYERYLDTTHTPNWEEVGLKWVTQGIDPDADRREKIADRIDQSTF